MRGVWGGHKHGSLNVVLQQRGKGFFDIDTVDHGHKHRVQSGTGQTLGQSLNDLRIKRICNIADDHADQTVFVPCQTAGDAVRPIAEGDRNSGHFPGRIRNKTIGLQGARDRSSRNARRSRDIRRRDLGRGATVSCRACYASDRPQMRLLTAPLAKARVDFSFSDRTSGPR